MPKAAPPCEQRRGSNTVKDWFIQDYGIYQEHTDRQRIGGRLVFQAKPVDGLEITVDDNWSQDKLTQISGLVSVSGSITVQLSNVTLAPDGTAVAFVQARVPITNGTPTDFQAQENDSGKPIEKNTLGLNVKWDMGEHSSALFDAYTSTSYQLPVVGLDADVGYGNGPYATNLGLVVPGGKPIVPYPTNFGPAGNAANFVNPAITGSHVLGGKLWHEQGRPQSVQARRQVGRRQFEVQVRRSVHT